jgi:inhibitor of cysteine peptidase
MTSLFTCLLCLLLVGCATSHPLKTLTPLDNGHEIRVTVGQVLVVELPSNHTTGFCWSERSDAESVVEKVGEPAYMQDSSPFGIVGAGGTEIWRFRAAKVGQQTLRLDYARPWEKDVAPVRTVSFDVVVGEK